MSPDRKKFGLVLDLSHLSWTPEKEAVHTARIFKETNKKRLEEDRGWQELHDSDPPRLSREEFEALAFNLSLSADDLHARIQESIDNPGGLSFKTFRYAIEHYYPWDVAEMVVKRHEARKEAFFDQAAGYYNSRKPLDLYSPIIPKPASVYEQRHKRRTKTRAQVTRMFKAVTRMEAVNNSDLDRHE